MARSVEEEREMDDLKARLEALEYHVGLKERPPPPVEPVAVESLNPSTRELLRQLAAKLSE